MVHDKTAARDEDYFVRDGHCIVYTPRERRSNTTSDTIWPKCRQVRLGTNEEGERKKKERGKKEGTRFSALFAKTRPMSHLGQGSRGLKGGIPGCQAVQEPFEWGVARRVEAALG